MIRRAPSLFAVALLTAGCSRPPAPQTETAAEPPPPAPAAPSAPFDPSPVRFTPGPAPTATPAGPAPGEFVLPKAPGPWPDLGSFPDPDSKPVTVPNATAPATGVAVSPAAGRAVVFDTVTLRGVTTTRVVLCDTATGAVVSEWEVRDVLAPVALSPDGRRVLARNDRTPTALILFTVGEDKKLRRKTWTPHAAEPEAGDVLVAGTGIDRSLHVGWAGFAGDTRIVSCSAGGQLRVFDADTAEKVGFLNGVLARPAVCPDGKTVLALTAAGLAALDVPGGQVAALRPFAPPPGEKALALSPDGKLVACAAPGRVAVLDPATGDRRDAILPGFGSGTDRLPPVAWAGNSHLLCGTTLYDPALPVPVWKYDGAAALAVCGPKAWAVTRPAADKTSTLRAVALPHPGLAAAVTAGLEKPGAFAAKAGDAVRVDVSGVPADKQAAVRTAIERSLTRSGYKPDPSSTVVVSAYEEKTPTPAHTKYVGVAQAQYARRAARLTVAKAGVTVWEAAWVAEPGTPLWLGPNGSLNGYLSRTGIGNPDYGLYTDAVLPAAIPGPAAPRAGFGASTFTAAGPAAAGGKE